MKAPAREYPSAQKARTSWRPSSWPLPNWGRRRTRRTGSRHPAHAAELAAFLADLGRFGAFLGLPQLPPDLDLTALFRTGEPPDAEAQPGDRFGEYELVELIGTGGMGVVYRARLAGTALVVALKRLKPSVGGEEARRFRAEVEAVIGLRHPNIVPVYHIGEHAGRPHFTMPLAEGGSLDQHICRFRGDPRATAELMLKVARAVHHAHQRQIVHRDLKPANILLDAAGEPQVADFGLAARLDATGAATAEAAGSLPWMAPEAVRGEPVTTGVDVWALGAILYELLTGERPFCGTTRNELHAAILNQDPRPPRAIEPRVPPDLAAVCVRCLAKESERRYESASAVALELERWLHDRPVRARTPTRRERTARWFRHNPVLAWGILLVTAILIAARDSAGRSPKSRRRGSGRRSARRTSTPRVTSPTASSASSTTWANRFGRSPKTGTCATRVRPETRTTSAPS